MGIEFIDICKDKIKIEDRIKQIVLPKEFFTGIKAKIYKVRNSHVLLELFYRRHFQRKLKPRLKFTDVCL